MDRFAARPIHDAPSGESKGSPIEVQDGLHVRHYPHDCDRPKRFLLSG
jgi:hypothetical protein